MNGSTNRKCLTIVHVFFHWVRGLGLLAGPSALIAGCVAASARYRRAGRCLFPRAKLNMPRSFPRYCAAGGFYNKPPANCQEGLTRFVLCLGLDGFSCLFFYHWFGGGLPFFLESQSQSQMSVQLISFHAPQRGCNNARRIKEFRGILWSMLQPSNRSPLNN